MKPLFLYLALFFSLAASAQAPRQHAVRVKNPEAVKKKLNDYSRKTTSINSQFVQKKHLDILEEDMKSSGIFYFQSPNKVRWEYKTPYPYIIVMDGKSMRINDGKKTQHYDTQSNKVFKEVNDLMLGMLRGNLWSGNKFTSELWEDREEIIVKLKPKQHEMKEFLSEIHLFFGKKNYQMQSMKMLEPGGDYTLIHLKNPKINAALPASAFQLN